MKLFSILCGDLDERRIWGEIDTNICMVESLCCLPETVIMLIGYTPIQNNFKKKSEHRTTFVILNLGWPALHLRDTDTELRMSWASLLAQMVNNLPIILETQVWSLGQEDPLEKGMATHSSIPAWKIPWTEEPGGLQSMGSQRVGHDWKTNTFTFSFFWMSHRKDTKEAFPLRQQDFLYQRSL